MIPYQPDETEIIERALLALEAEALGQASLDRDWEEARFRAQRIEAMALARGALGVAAAARGLRRALGTKSDAPGTGVGSAFAALTDAMDPT